MCCLFTTLVILGPRAIDVIWWLFDPSRWSLAFDNFIVPALGVIFLPWVTLVYVLVFPGGVDGTDWLWLGLALLADLASYGGGAFGNRDRIPGYRY